jgi:hypothetical protein
MPAATIICTNIVEFSAKPTLDQTRLIGELTREMAYELRPFLLRSTDLPRLLYWPTGTGFALGFLHLTGQRVDRARLFHFVLSIQKWAGKEQISLRIGVHVGPVEVVPDVGNRPSICGEAIETARVLTNSAAPRQVLLSEAAHEEYVGSEASASTSPPFSEWKLDGPSDVFEEHRIQLKAYGMALRD